MDHGIVAIPDCEGIFVEPEIADDQAKVSIKMVELGHPEVIIERPLKQRAGEKRS